MHGIDKPLRACIARLEERLRQMPAVALLGPRQCGKTTLAKQLLAKVPGSLYIDLERPSHAARLQDPEAFFSSTRQQLVCVDEVQRRPDLFPLLRSELDERQDADSGRLLLLGSASPDVLQHATESLAGRIGFIELTPFSAEESEASARDLPCWWLRGGFPRSLLSRNDHDSFAWREDFIRTFLERDLVALRPRLDVPMLTRLWRMCAHLHGQQLNTASLSTSLGISAPTVRHHLDLLTGTYLLRLLPAFSTNLGKRLVKAPRLYIRDSGILHALLGITTRLDLLGHPSYGSSWEGLIVEEIVSRLPRHVHASYYRTSNGSEIDLILDDGRQRMAIECKASASPHLTAGFWHAITDIAPAATWVAAPVEHSFSLKPGVQVGNPSTIIRDLATRGWRVDPLVSSP
jgi:uncharacterized protein